jgi:hypothetical protein
MYSSNFNTPDQLRFLFSEVMKTSANIGLTKAGQTEVIEHLYFYQHLWCAPSFGQQKGELSGVVRDWQGELPRKTPMRVFCSVTPDGAFGGCANQNTRAMPPKPQHCTRNDADRDIHISPPAKGVQ